MKMGQTENAAAVKMYSKIADLSASSSQRSHDLKALRADIERGTYSINLGRIADGIMAEASRNAAWRRARTQN